MGIRAAVKCDDGLLISTAPWPDVEKQALDRIEIQAIRELVKNTNPRYWEVFYQVKLYGEDVKIVADRMGISVQRVHQLMNKVSEIAKNYRKENQ